MRVAVVGVGMTKVGRFVGKSLRDLAAEAGLRAVEEAGWEPPEAVVVGNMLSSLSEQENLGALIADYLGYRGVPAFKVEAACGSGGAAVAVGYSLVRSGLRRVLVIGVEKLTEAPTPVTTRRLAWASDADYELVHGPSFAGLNALLMRYYMSKYGVTREEMGSWSVLMHENGFANPYAHIRKKVDLQTVINSPIIADPIRLFDACPISDGAAAVYLAAEDEARKLSDTPVWVEAVSSATDAVDVLSRRYLDRLEAAIRSAREAYRIAGVEPSDIDVAEVHDAYSITGVLGVEAMGFADIGKAAKLVHEGRFAPGDKPTINPSGGLKSRGHPVGATGVYQVVEVVMQLRGDFPGVKVSAEVGAAQNVGGVGSNVTTTILRR